MTETMVLSDAVLILGLSPQEVADLLRLIEDERAKHRRFDEDLREHNEFPPDEELVLPCPITDGITGREVGLGRALLRAIPGTEAVAASLGFWQGYGGDFHNITVDERCLDFAAPVRSAAEEELLAQFSPPPNTVDPRRLDHAASPSRAENRDKREMPPSPEDLEEELLGPVWTKSTPTGP